MPIWPSARRLGLAVARVGGEAGTGAAIAHGTRVRARARGHVRGRGRERRPVVGVMNARNALCSAPVLVAAT